jgi:hypothetical protein
MAHTFLMHSLSLIHRLPLFIRSVVANAHLVAEQLKQTSSSYNDY